MRRRGYVLLSLAFVAIVVSVFSVTTISKGKGVTKVASANAWMTQVGDGLVAPACGSSSIAGGSPTCVDGRPVVTISWAPTAGASSCDTWSAAGKAVVDLTVNGSPIASKVFTPPPGVTSVNYLVVGGGGGGEADTGGVGIPDGTFRGGGGGGGGAVLTGTLSIPANTSQVVMVGLGGASDTNGGNSTFSTITALGGGHGGSESIPPWYVGASGGSGGGGSFGGGGGLGASGGQNGGNGTWNGNEGSGGGGGGAGTAGASGTSPFTGGAGGAGISSSISGSAENYGGGGGGGVGGAGGVGGGGDGAAGVGVGQHGVDHRGGGGGGTVVGFNSGYAAGSRGGSGVVIISYTASSCGTGGQVTQIGSTCIHKFEASVGLPATGSYTWNGGSVGTTYTYSVDCFNTATGAADNLSTGSFSMPAFCGPAPTASISASPTSVPSGTQSTLTWSSTNATSCTAPSGNWLNSGSGSTTFTPPSGVSSVSYLVVAGGGGGGGDGGGGTYAGEGGGGAGGMRTGTLAVTAQPYTVTVGAGGVGGAGTGGYNKGSNGANSVFSSITAIGGGGGGAGTSGGSAGGSGGGASYTGAGGAATAGQGSVGGSSTALGAPWPAAGGGGAGGAGVANSAGGAGGAGLSSSLSGAAVTYSAGGAGAPSWSSGSGVSGASGTGNGGGGAGGGAGGRGGSGIVVIRYTSGTCGTGGTVTQSGGDCIHTFTNGEFGGSGLTGAITVPTTFTFQCFGPGGQTGIRSTTVTPIANTPPVGTFEGANCTQLQGWAWDGTASSTSIQVQVYKDGPFGTGTLLGSYTANVPRSDINSTYGITGDHGFLISTPDLGNTSSHTLYVYAIDSTGGPNVLTTGSPKTVSGCTYNAPPVGWLDSASCSSVSGWAYDPTASGTSIQVALYKDGVIGTGTLLGTYTANTSRPDVNTAFGITGNHGYSITTPSLGDTLSHSLYVYALDSSGGLPALASQSPMTVSGCPVPVPPTATLTATPSAINSGQSSTLSWSSTNATSCTGTGFSTGGATSGSGVSTGALSSDQNYQVTCTGTVAPPATASASVTIVTANVSISATPTRVVSGDPATITWDATSVNSCTITKNGTTWKSLTADGTHHISGSQVDPSITSQTSYVISCIDQAGTTVSKTQVVNLISAFVNF